MKCFDYGYELFGNAIFSYDLPESLAANRIERLGEINKCCETMASLFLALLL